MTYLQPAVAVSDVAGERRLALSVLLEVLLDLCQLLLLGLDLLAHVCQLLLSPILQMLHDVKSNH